MLWSLVLVAVVVAAAWPVVRVWVARPGDVLTQKKVTAIRVYSDPWWQRVRNEPWCGPVEGYTGCELQGERRQPLLDALQKPERSAYVWRLPLKAVDMKYSVEVVFQDGSRRYLTAYTGMPAGTFYGAGPDLHVYRTRVSIWQYHNQALAQSVERLLTQ